MASCAICEAKISFMASKILVGKTQTYTNRGDTISVCDKCYDQMLLLQNGDFSAYKYIHKYVDTSADIRLKGFVSTWEKIPKEILEERQKIEADNKQAADELERKKATLLLTTGFDFEGYAITKYLGVLSGEVALGTGFLSEFSAGLSDFLGAQSNSFALKIETAREAAIDKLLEKAVFKNANAIIGLKYDYITFSSNIIGVIATGTVVQISKQ